MEDNTGMVYKLPPLNLVQPKILPSTHNENFDMTEKPVDNNSSFFATFVDGSSFRNMIEYLRLASTEGVFRFTKHNIYYEQVGKDGNILNVVSLKTYELTDYEFSSTSDEIVVGLNLCKIRNICKNIGKKDHIDLYKLSTEPNNLYIRIKSQSEKGSDYNLYIAEITTTDYTVFKLPKYTKGKNNPTCTVYQSDFSKLCKSLVTIKCTHTVIRGFEKGAVFKGILNTGEIGSVKEFGKCNSSNSPQVLKSIFTVANRSVVKAIKPPPRLNIGEIGEIEKFNIQIYIVKYLAKLNALNPTGTIKMYIERGIPLKMVCDIGSFGKMNVFLMG